MACDLCGKIQEQFLAIIEGTQMSVCGSCVHYGKKLRPIEQEKKITHQKTPREEITTTINPNYSKQIREKRQQQNLTQEELAHKIGEKASTLKKIEAGNTEPSIHIAEKLQRLLKITIIQQEVQEVTQQNYEKKGQQTLTLGDFIKKSKKS